MSSDKYTDLKLRINNLKESDSLLEAFLVQSAYIESVLKRLFKYNLGLEFNQEISKEIETSYVFIAKTNKFCLSAGWISQNEYDELKKYFEKRNKIVHDLASFSLNKSFLLKLIESGEKIIENHGNIEKFVNSIRHQQTKDGLVSEIKAPTLSEREKGILRLRFKGKTLDSIGKEYGITRERVRQIEKKAIRKMEGLVTRSNIAVRELKIKKLSKMGDAETFINKICEKQSFSVQDLKGKSRKADLVLFRHIVAHHLKNNMGLSYSKIGEILGGRDHTTIIHANKRITKILEEQKG